MTGQTPSDPAPPTREHVQLGGRTVELAPEDAATVRQAFQDLASTYGQSLDEQRRQILSTIGTPVWQQPPAPQPAFEPMVDVPDPDLLFSNKDLWAQGFAANLEGRIRRSQAEQAGLLQGAVTAVDQELRRRDLAAQAQSIHDTEMEAMLERKNLGDHRRLVQTVYNEQYDAMKHLPMNVAFDQMGSIVEQEIAAIRGAQATPAAAAQQTKPPPMIQSGMRASAAAAPAPQRQGKTLSDLIRAHHEQFLGRHAA